MNILCLQSLGNMPVETLIKKINAKHIFSSQKYEKIEEKGNVFICGEKVKVKRRYCRQPLKFKVGNEFINVWLENGIAVFHDTIIYQSDIYISYHAKATTAAVKIVEQLLETVSFILVEPNVYERIKQIQGSFNPMTLPAYKNANINNGLLCHLCWQIYAVSAAWAKFLENPSERVSLRQLRVKIRRLRSCLSFFKPALKLVECTEWQSKLRAQGEELSRLRELDVVLMSLARMRKVASETTQKTSSLEEIFAKSRDIEMKRIHTQLSLAVMTLELAQLVFWLQNRPATQEYSAKLLKKFLYERVDEWSNNIMCLTDRYPEFSDMQAAHKIRIKVKRFRYALMSFPEVNKEAGNMLRKLKRLQDMLGFLHDDYVNSQLAENIITDDNDALRYEAAVFTGWESAKVEASINMSKYLWEDFCDELKAWKK